MKFTTPETFPVCAWLAGNITTAELDDFLTDPETVRRERDKRVEDLLYLHGAYDSDVNGDWPPYEVVCRPFNIPAFSNRVSHIECDRKINLDEWIDWVMS